ncbi:ARM repeat-containing protein [Piedraia hortae CBS 480.64]|uniref:ARM repeat-containing protein n=1 Tax=Piedraia hortae CBS 480.64 TaxID=1314780 RepID=A0A6A7C4N6_9PEZI|nr:ARM repeat-containing protein [Piedraia hortae CBS 480.64]
MASSTRPDFTVNLDGLGQLTPSQRSTNASASTSPLEPPAGSGVRHLGGLGPSSRGSPSKDFGGSRLFPRRAREIQAQEGVSPSARRPPTIGSGHSTPLRETIPESPGSDSFPDFDSAATVSTPPATRRARAGTVPSRFPGLSSQSLLLPKSSRPTPSSSPYYPGTPSSEQAKGGVQSANSALLSRLRAGSLPHRSYISGANPFGSTLFASSWMASRERANTLHSIRSSDAPSSPHDSPADNDVRTLDYLGLAETPSVPSLSNGVTIEQLAALNAFNNKNLANRFRSYSVNAKERYDDGEDDDMDQYDPLQTYPPATAAEAAHAAAVHEAVRQHNLEVQAFATLASASRPRARTAGVLDSPVRAMRSAYVQVPSRLDNSISASGLHEGDGSDYDGLSNAMQNMQLNSFELEGGLETPTRSLWLGNIPSSTTISSLEVLFSPFGPIEFARVLTHKSCGFVNFERIDSAITAKAQCNGKEMFPGCGPLRIGFAKEQNATSGTNSVYPASSPDPFVTKKRAEPTQLATTASADTAAAALETPDLMSLRDEVFNTVQQLGATVEDQKRIGDNLERAMSYDSYVAEIPPIPEASHNRVHDAPRLREVRKRIDNNSCTQMEIENLALDMLPEIAELSSDYLGNTVVQKLFERCSEETKEAMLAEIGPHLAEIGVHKNGTWAAQKIIDVARTPTQMSMIVDALRPHGVNLLLDQYGNYVMQCCLRFQSPLNDFIFDTMISRLWDVAQGRFGARAMRACLESHFATNDQKRLMAAAIALHSVQLATNSNGALLLTWFLDTCTFPRRRSVLAPRLIPHLVYLCTHKVAYLSVLKIINQRNELDARDAMLRALLYDEKVLTDIVSDQTCGATLIFKVLTTPFLDDNVRPECIQNVRNVLMRLKVQPSQGYRRLMDEVGMSTRRGGTPASQEGRSSSRSRMNGPLPHLDTNHNNMRTPFQPQMAPGMAMDRSGHMNYDPFGNGVSPHYAHSSPIAGPGMSPLQYQQAIMAQRQAPPGFYGTPGPVHANMPMGMPFNSPQPGMMDPYRAPVVPPMGYQQPPGFAPQVMGMNSRCHSITQVETEGEG